MLQLAGGSSLAQAIRYGLSRWEDNPQAYLTDVLIKLVNNWPNRRLAELTPWTWTAATP